jgi:serine/threonine-protein kinase
VHHVHDTQMSTGELRRVGPYEIRETIGHGGMAAVYKAYQPRLDRIVAIKVISSHLASEPEFSKRFEQEAQTVAKLNHPNIVVVHDYGDENGIPYLVMEYIDGVSLADLMEEGIPPDQVLDLMTQVAAGLDYAHSKGVVHRDIKPQNVMVTRDGRAVLADFGLARMMESAQRLTMSGGIVGTPEYMSPEQAAGRNVDHRTDIYALGVILYEIVAGLRPFTAETPLGVLMKHIQERPPSVRALRPDLPSGIEAVIEKALAKKPDDRFQKASDLVRAYRDVLSLANLAPAAGGPTVMPFEQRGPAAQSPAVQQSQQSIVPTPPQPTARPPSLKTGPPSFDLNKYGVRPTAERAAEPHVTPSLVQLPRLRQPLQPAQPAAPKLKTCPNCHAEIPSDVTICPNCTFMLPFEQVVSRPERPAPERRTVRVNLLPYNFGWDPTGLEKARRVTHQTVTQLAADGWELVTPLEAAGTFIQGRTARGPVVQGAILTLQRTVG